MLSKRLLQTAPKQQITHYTQPRYKTRWCKAHVKCANASSFAKMVAATTSAANSTNISSVCANASVQCLCRDGMRETRVPRRTTQKHYTRDAATAKQRHHSQAHRTAQHETHKYWSENTHITCDKLQKDARSFARAHIEN